MPLLHVCSVKFKLSCTVSHQSISTARNTFTKNLLSQNCITKKCYTKAMIGSSYFRHMLVLKKQWDMFVYICVEHMSSIVKFIMGS